MTIDSFMNIYSDMTEQKQNVKNANDKATGNENHCFLHCRLSNNALTKLKVNLGNISFIDDENGNPTSVIRIIPESSITTASEFMPNCYAYIDINDVICVSDAERALGFTAEDKLKNILNNKKRMENFKQRKPVTEKQKDMLNDIFKVIAQSSHDSAITIASPVKSSPPPMPSELNDTFEPVSSVINDEDDTDNNVQTDNDDSLTAEPENIEPEETELEEDIDIEPEEYEEEPDFDDDIQDDIPDDIPDDDIPE